MSTMMKYTQFTQETLHHTSMLRAQLSSQFVNVQNHFYSILVARLTFQHADEQWKKSSSSR